MQQMAKANLKRRLKEINTETGEPALVESDGQEF